MMSNRVIKNASWIIVCKIIQSILALVISMLTARYLGPSQFGTINYAASLVSFTTPIMQLGINSILVQQIVNYPEKEGEILGTSVTLSIGSSFFCIIGITTFATIVNVGETETILVCFLYSTILIFQAVEMLQYWFQAKLLSKYTSITMLIAYLIVSIYRIILLATNQSIYWFSIANAFDCLLIAIALLILYRKLGGRRLSFSKETARNLLSKGRYFIVSSMMITIFSQTDRIMLKLMIDESATGYYSAAVSCALLTNFVFSAIMDSARPSLFESKKSNECEYKNKFIVMFSIITYLSLMQCVFMTLFAKVIIYILYGAAFEPSIKILQLAVWYTTFSYIGAVRSIWILAEDKQKYLWVINLSGAVTNIILNYFFIIKFGMLGAALASLLTQFFTNVVVIQIIPALRSSNKLMISGLNPKYFCKAVKAIIKR